MMPLPPDGPHAGSLLRLAQQRFLAWTWAPGAEPVTLTRWNRPSAGWRDM